MPYKNKEDTIEYNKRYYKEQRENILKRLKERRNAEPEKHSKWKKDYYVRNKKEINARKKVRTDEQKQKAVEYLGGKCQQCGLEDICVNVFDFHHRDPKEKSYDISTKRYRNFESIKQELDKCDLLCANCHRRKHSGCERKI